MERPLRHADGTIERQANLPIPDLFPSSTILSRAVMSSAATPELRNFRASFSFLARLSRYRRDHAALRGRIRGQGGEVQFERVRTLLGEIRHTQDGAEVGLVQVLNLDGGDLRVHLLELCLDEADDDHAGEGTEANRFLVDLVGLAQTKRAMSMSSEAMWTAWRSFREIFEPRPILVVPMAFKMLRVPGWSPRSSLPAPMSTGVSLSSTETSPVTGGAVGAGTTWPCSSGLRGFLPPTGAAVAGASNTATPPAFCWAAGDPAMTAAARVARAAAEVVFTFFIRVFLALSAKGGDGHGGEMQPVPGVGQNIWPMFAQGSRQ